MWQIINVISIKLLLLGIANHDSLEFNLEYRRMLLISICHEFHARIYSVLDIPVPDY